MHSKNAVSNQPGTSLAASQSKPHNPPVPLHLLADVAVVFLLADVAVVILLADVAVVFLLADVAAVILLADVAVVLGI
ncbi:hypothetical protein EB796_007578 [Bugula neritina]|uniref:Uncharacterized protein n=1 Tax=Bugula neritina TaxID=10212 RepID=A0A7J7K986_BUGNE|nr:hypothetical protein EB796_007578 [Bugula neritina]